MLAHNTHPTVVLLRHCAQVQPISPLAFSTIAPSSTGLPRRRGPSHNTDPVAHRHKALSRQTERTILYRPSLHHPVPLTDSLVDSLTAKQVFAPRPLPFPPSPPPLGTPLPERLMTVRSYNLTKHDYCTSCSWAPSNYKNYTTATSYPIRQSHCIVSLPLLSWRSSHNSQVDHCPRVTRTLQYPGRAKTSHSSIPPTTTATSHW